MTGYYGKKLSGARLSEVYNTSVERVRQYLDGEIEFVRRRLRGGDPGRGVLRPLLGRGRARHHGLDLRRADRQGQRG